MWRRIGRGALVVAAGTAALALAGPLALRPFVDAAGAAGAAGEVSVAFVLDFGPGTTPVTGCVDVPASDNRYDALAAFASQQGLAQPTYNSSGLLCSINGIPSSGCGQVVAGGYIYWSYFTGGQGGWTYSSTGAFGTVTPGDVEGWRFQNPGSGRPNDPPPRSSARFAAICGSGTVTPPTTQPSGGRQARGLGAASPRPPGPPRPRPRAASGTRPKPDRRRDHDRPRRAPRPPRRIRSDTTTYAARSIPVPADPEKGLDAAKHSSGAPARGPAPIR